MSDYIGEWRQIAQACYGGPHRDLMVASWERSARAGVPRTGEPQLRRVPEDDLARRLRQSRELIEIASKHLRWLSQMLVAQGVAHTAYLADRDGIILFSVSNDPAILEKCGLSPGFDWSEAAMGTNGAGTALACERPVAVVGADHYAAAWHEFT